MRVIFFDIDGTLIRSGGAGKAAMHAVLSRDFQVGTIREDINFSGRTDPQIARELLELHDLEPSWDNITRLHDRYVGYLAQELLQRSPILLPGVRELLDRLRHRGFALGLLTGNIRTGAEIKLSHFQIWDYFSFGGFGDRCLDRDAVARAAIAEAESALGAIDPARCWVVGDTPLDVSCARAVGAKVLAVTTGWHSAEELAAHEPDALLEDLTQADDVFAE